MAAEIIVACFLPFFNGNRAVASLCRQILRAGIASFFALPVL
jgi:hypothetical protein